MYRVELDNGRPVGVLCDTLDELRGVLGDRADGNSSNGNGHAAGGKSQAIRDYLATNPDAKPATVASVPKSGGRPRERRTGQHRQAFTQAEVRPQAKAQVTIAASPTRVNS